MATKASTTDRSIGQRTIETGRFARACSEDMAVTFTGPATADVHSQSGNTYHVKLETGECSCPDHDRRGERLICKHVQRTSLAALYDPNQRVTETVARVTRFARESGCQHGVRGCAGPTTAGARGLPCPGCCDAVRSADVDEYTVWTTLDVSDTVSA